MIPLKLFKLLKINILHIIISTTTSLNGFSQIFEGGQNPPSVKFRQIKTENFQIIYPTLLEDDAQRLANVLEKSIVSISKSLNKKPHPISIILQGNTVESNGFVQSAPRRSEFYTMPAQEFDTQDWLNSLAVHELRHVVQFDKLASYLKSPLFEELKLALFGINLPPWFYEGDAVITETILTPGGRGRQPSFDMILRANLLSKKHYSYSKNYLGSFRDFTPDYYTLGYFMTTKLRRDSGADILDKTFSRMAGFPVRPYNLSSSLKKFTGHNTRDLYQHTMMEIDSLWQYQSDQAKPINYVALNEVNPKIPANYLLPYPLDNGNVLALKSSKAVTNQIVIINNKKEKKIIDIGYQTEPNLHYAAEKIVWDEFRYDKRYSKQSFNVICFYDLKTKKFRQLSHKTRYFSPALSPDGRKIITVNVSGDNKFSLQELDVETGNTLKVFPNPNQYILQTPQYNQDASKIVVTVVNQNGKSLLLYDTQTSTSEKLFNEEHFLISRPTFWKDGIIYKSHEEGIDNIYFFNLTNKQRYRITSSKFGAFYPALNKETDELYFNDYQYTGHNIVSLHLNRSDLFYPSKPHTNTLRYFEPLKQQEKAGNILTDIPNNSYSSKPYREVKNLFYFHSLRPVVEYKEDEDYKIGFNMISDNKLNTFSASAGYAYNASIHANEFRAKIAYKKFYPVITASYSNIERLSSARFANSSGQSWLVPFNWREEKTSLTVSVPFRLNWLNKNIRTGIETNTSYTNRYNVSLPLSGFNKIVKLPMQYQYYWSFATLQSQRDLAPRWGFSFTINYLHLPFENRLKGDIFFIKTTSYLPGLLANHALQTRLNWQNSSGTFRYNTEISRARGYAYLHPVSSLNNSFLFDYKFPIAYPDWEIGPLAYVKRLRTGLFTDFENNIHKSYGISFSVDMNLLRYYLPNFAFDTRFIMPAEKNISKKPIFEVGLTYNY